MTRPGWHRLVAGRYRLDDFVGRGGMGVVWRATDTLLHRTVAVKELRAPAGADPAERRVFVDRALREARAAARLDHPNIVGVHDVIATAGPDADGPVVYIVMEYVPVGSLAELLDRGGPLPASRVAAIGLGVLDALDAAHRVGLAHRDVKPANILVGPDRVVLTDFGIALAVDDSRLTESGVMGTQGYLAPECFDAGLAGPPADLWALGATLFRAVAGYAAFERATPLATMRAILLDDVPTAPGDPRLAHAIDGLLTRPVATRSDSGTARRQLQAVAGNPDPGAALGASPPQAPSHPPGVGSRSGRRTRRVLLGGAAAAAAATGITLAVVHATSGHEDAAGARPSVPTTSAGSSPRSAGVASTGPATGSCGADRSIAIDVAAAYYASANASMTDDAQACTYRNTVPRSVTERIAGAGEVSTSTTDSGFFRFTAVKLSITVRVDMEPDGKYWVTSVSVL